MYIENNIDSYKYNNYILHLLNECAQASTINITPPTLLSNVIKI